MGQPAVAEEPSAPPSRGRRYARRAVQVLSHPLSLLLIGAVVSSVLIPFYTGQSQRP